MKPVFTKEQRDLLLRLDSRWARTAGAGKGLYKAASLRPFVEIEWTCNNGRYRQRAKLTDRGLAVKAALQMDSLP